MLFFCISYERRESNIYWGNRQNKLTLSLSTFDWQYLGRVAGYTSPLSIEHTRSAILCLHARLLARWMALSGS